MYSLTFYPDPFPGTDTCSGVVARSTGIPGESWSTLRGGAGNLSGDGSLGYIDIIMVSGSTTDLWQDLFRGIVTFDTSVITSNMRITSSVLSLYGDYKADNASISPDFNIFAVSPGSFNSVVDSDYGTFGTTPFSSAISYAGITTSGYNDFTLNSNGIANIDIDGISAFGVRNENYDVDNVAPTWSGGSLLSGMGFKSSSVSGTSQDPKLVVFFNFPLSQVCNY